jgi:peptidyl-prolyl cis-trans isomerase SurA
MILRIFFLLLCSGLCTLSVGQTKKSRKSTSAPTILFLVNKKPVTTDEFLYLYRKNHQDLNKDYTTEKIEEYLRLYTNFKLKVEEARHRGMDTTRAFRKEFTQYKDELRKPYLPGNRMTDSLVQMTYKRMQEEVRASHILVSLSTDAPPADTLRAFNKIMDIRKKVISGEDFAKAAAQYSEDPSAKSNHGDLGYFTAMQMVYPFENAAFTTPVGQISNPVKTKFGYHILKVVDRRPARGEVEVSHIMVRTGEEKSVEQAKNAIFDIYNELQAGAKWEDLCRQYSEDPSSKENGGKLRPFGTGVMGNIPEFERVAFELEKPGQISDPVQTQYGWHILRLERKIPMGSFAEVSANLKNRVARDERSQISREALQAKLRKDLGLSESLETKISVLNLADTTLRTGDWKPTLRKKNDVLFTLGPKAVGVNDFLIYATENQEPNSKQPKRYLEELYENFIDEQVMTIQEETIARTNPEYRFLLNEYYEGILLFEIMEKEVWNKASEDSVGQRRYFEQNRDKYVANDRLKATFYSSASQAAISQLRSMLAEGDMKKIQEHVARNKIKVESGYYQKEEKAILKQISWEEGVHPAENNGMYYLASVKQVLPAGQMSFEEARPALISDYQNHLEEIWVKDLRKKYSVKVSEKGRNLIFQQLQKK